MPKIESELDWINSKNTSSWYNGFNHDFQHYMECWVGFFCTFIFGKYYISVKDFQSWINFRTDAWSIVYFTASISKSWSWLWKVLFHIMVLRLYLQKVTISCNIFDAAVIFPFLVKVSSSVALIWSMMSFWPVFKGWNSFWFLIWHQYIQLQNKAKNQSRSHQISVNIISFIILFSLSY